MPGHDNATFCIGEAMTGAGHFRMFFIFTCVHFREGGRTSAVLVNKFLGRKAEEIEPRNMRNTRKRDRRMKE